MLVRIYDLEPARAVGVIHIGSSQKEKAGGVLMDSECLAGSKPLPRSEAPAPSDSLSCQGRCPWT